MENKAENITDVPIVESRVSILQLINHAKDIVTKLTSMESLSEVESKLDNFLYITSNLKEEYIKTGTDGVLNNIGNAITKYETIIERSKEISSVIHIDISDCIKDQKEQLKDIGKKFISHCTNEATIIIDKAVEQINENKKNITNLVKEISDLPEKLSNKIITWNPLPVLKEFIDYVTELSSKVPDQLAKMISDITNIINNLPSELLFCVKDTIQKAEDDADNVLKLFAGNISIKFGEAVIEYLLK